ncbi:MAG: hypothetical protein JWO69_1625 [Thermoleophilia bacterium]|nr:hypothetical protein [Thermoleophilia bacterium]
MSLYAFAAPVLPGKSEENRKFVTELGRSPEARSIHQKAGIDRTRIYQQTLQQGDYAVVVWDTDDGERAMKKLLSANDDFSSWMRSELTDIHGRDEIDLDMMPTTELVAEWSASDHDPSSGDWAFIVPIGRGKAEAFRSMIEEMYEGSQRAGFEQTRRLLGVTRQSMFLLETEAGSFALPVIEGPGAARVFVEQLRRDDHPFFAWWRNQIRNVTGRIPTNPPQVEKLLDLKAGVRAKSKR